MSDVQSLVTRLRARGDHLSVDAADMIERLSRPHTRVDPAIIEEASRATGVRIRAFTEQMAREIGARVDAELKSRRTP